MKYLVEILIEVDDAYTEFDVKTIIQRKMRAIEIETVKGISIYELTTNPRGK